MGDNGRVRYDEPLFRPPSEAESFILQATLGCSWNACTYCAMYRSKRFRVRPLDAILADIAEAGVRFGSEVRHAFVADGDPLAMGLGHWEPILRALANAFPRLRRVGTYATARNLLAKTPAELKRLRDLGLSLLYLGPESGDDVTLHRLAKGATAADHLEAARKIREAGMDQSLIFLLGAGGRERSEVHARASGQLATAMDPKYLSTLTLTVVPGTPLARLEGQGRFELPDVRGLLTELRWFMEEARPTAAIFRSNHASNYLPLGGRLPRDREAILATLDEALAGRRTLRPEWTRGL
ncbi:MAG TPA: radical SAM protein [Holophagaceae bacterium]